MNTKADTTSLRWWWDGSPWHPVAVQLWQDRQLFPSTVEGAIDRSPLNISQKFDRTVLGILFRSLMGTPSKPHADESCLGTTSWPNSSGVMLGQRSWRRGENLRAKSRMTFHRSKGTSRCRSHRAFQAWANAASRSSFVPVHWSWVTTSAGDTASMSCNHRHLLSMNNRQGQPMADDRFGKFQPGAHSSNEVVKAILRHWHHHLVRPDK